MSSQATRIDSSLPNISDLFQSAPDNYEEGFYEEMINKSLEYNSTLKYNYIECRSKLALLMLLKDNSIETYHRDNSESALKSRKTETKEIKKNIRDTEKQIFQLVQELYDLHQASPDAQDKLSESFNSSMLDSSMTENDHINYQAVIKRYEGMLNWYKRMQEIHKVIGGVEINSIEEENSLTKLTTTLTFHPDRAVYTFVVYFQPHDQSFVKGIVFGPSKNIDISDIVERTKKTNNISFLFREVRNRILHGKQW